MSDVGCRMSIVGCGMGMYDVGCQMSDVESDVGFSQLSCRIFTTRMSDFHNFLVGFLQLGCWIFTTLLSDSQQLGSDGTYKLPKYVGCPR